MFSAMARAITCGVVELADQHRHREVGLRASRLDQLLDRLVAAVAGDDLVLVLVLGVGAHGEVLQHALDRDAVGEPLEPLRIEVAARVELRAVQRRPGHRLAVAGDDRHGLGRFGLGRRRRGLRVGLGYGCCDVGHGVLLRG
jgi:hypothetical protein